MTGQPSLNHERRQTPHSPTFRSSPKTSAARGGTETPLVNPTSHPHNILAHPHTSLKIFTHPHTSLKTLTISSYILIYRHPPSRVTTHTTFTPPFPLPHTPFIYARTILTSLIYSHIRPRPHTPFKSPTFPLRRLYPLKTLTPALIPAHATTTASSHTFTHSFQPSRFLRAHPLEESFSVPSWIDLFSPHPLEESFSVPVPVLVSYPYPYIFLPTLNIPFKTPLPLKPPTPTLISTHALTHSFQPPHVLPTRPSEESSSIPAWIDLFSRVLRPQQPRPPGATRRSEALGRKAARFHISPCHCPPPPSPSSLTNTLSPVPCGCDAPKCQGIVTSLRSAMEYPTPLPHLPNPPTSARHPPPLPKPPLTNVMYPSPHPPKGRHTPYPYLPNPRQTIPHPSNTTHLPPIQRQPLLEPPPPTHPRHTPPYPARVSVSAVKTA
ncbi:hypothetical protein C7M84_016846 [Penaeus vannamei]|uniref:Uncharacterized protein n=1 Tax=Penaeus vannamei TaxID=6689 RepID=A0A3R7Q084_PENVA|nr:hypothetical protein C7M84_016846 [Penaeus vannamei]